MTVARCAWVMLMLSRVMCWADVRLAISVVSSSSGKVAFRNANVFSRGSKEVGNIKEGRTVAPAETLWRSVELRLRSRCSSWDMAARRVQSCPERRYVVVLWKQHWALMESARRVRGRSCAMVREFVKSALGVVKRW